jgi:hypothetical protein
MGVPTAIRSTGFYVPTEGTPRHRADLTRQANVRALATYLDIPVETLADGLIAAAGRERLQVIRGGHNRQAA